MKSNKTITIGGRVFEVVKSVPMKSKIEPDLYNCYNKPSQAKIDIYRDWVFEWNKYHYLQHFGIASYNSMQFTLQGFYDDETTNESYAVYITKDHNRAMKIR